RAQQGAGGAPMQPQQWVQIADRQGVYHQRTNTIRVMFNGGADHRRAIADVQNQQQREKAYRKGRQQAGTFRTNNGRQSGNQQNGAGRDIGSEHQGIGFFTQQGGQPVGRRCAAVNLGFGNVAEQRTEQKNGRDHHRQADPAVGG